MLLVITLPISALMLAVLQTRYSDVNVTMTIEQSIAHNRRKMHEVNRQTLDDLQLQSQETRSTKSSQYNQDVDRLLELGYELIEMLESDYDLQEVFEHFWGNLTQEELQDVVDMWASLGSVDNNDDNNLGVASKGVYRLKIIFELNLGYITGALASYLAGYWVGIYLVTVTAGLGPLAWLLSTVAGIVAGYIVETMINFIVYNLAGDIKNYRYEIGSIPYFWTPWGGDKDSYLNILDVVIMVISAIGGGLGRGSRPAGVARPSIVRA
jgi:hypothetical protein